MTTEPLLPFTPDQLAAHALLSELRTRIATQPLPYQHGVETRALESLRDVFQLTRQAMKDHPGCAAFASIATRMLNLDLRPVTAKWHKALAAGILNSRDGANEFRADLADVQVKLRSFTANLQTMAYGTQTVDDFVPDVMSRVQIDSCFEPLHYGIDTSASGKIAQASNINLAEATEVAHRRARYSITGKMGIDAIGLSLSGGGIRSATFCLGVVQVLVKRKLTRHFDYLSTVSGGGYTGSFITSRIGRQSNPDQQDDPFAAIGNPEGPDTEPVRFLRQNAKYLSVVDLKRRWLLVVSTIAGLLLNWTAPLCLLALAALASNFIATKFAPSDWLFLAAAFGSGTAAAVVLYGVLLRFAGAAGWLGGIFLGAGATLSLLALVGYGVELGYPHFQWLVYEKWSVSGLVAAMIVSVPAIIRFVPIFNSASLQKLLLKAVLLLAGIIVPALAITVFYLLRMLGDTPLEATAGGWSPFHFRDGIFWLELVAASSGTVALLFLNINLTGLHKLYRDQLAKTFVERGPDDVLDLPLRDLNASQAAPYHLINATLNLPSSKSPVVRDRKGDFFLFSKHWSGAPSVEYYKTSEWTTNGHHIDLATAMAISGAAVSPQMGLGSIPTLSALLTLLNIRLGFWIARPSRTVLPTPGFTCLLREMIGAAMSEKNSWLNLSDGGHIENMGIYELLRRRCKFLVCVDGEADPQSTFHGQLTLVRHAQIDFGIRIEPKLDELRPSLESKLSRTHLQFFRIHYPATGDGRPPGIGLMLYLKLSLTGDETELLKGYRAMHPDFPHQTTLDQFYDEEQFEAYRQLGVHVAEGAFSSALIGNGGDPPDVSDWFKRLAKNMLEPEKY